MGNKIRVNGVTVDSKEKYSGNIVIQLVNASYQNGYERGRRDAGSDNCDQIKDAFNQGREVGRGELMNFKAMLKTLLDEGAEVK